MELRQRQFSPPGAESYLQSRRDCSHGTESQDKSQNMDICSEWAVLPCRDHPGYLTDYHNRKSCAYLQDFRNKIVTRPRHWMHPLIFSHREETRDPPSIV